MMWETSRKQIDDKHFEKGTFKNIFFYISVIKIITKTKVASRTKGHHFSISLLKTAIYSEG